MRKLKRLIWILKFYKFNICGAFGFIRLNYFSKNIRRFGGAYFYPSSNSKIILSSTAIIELHGSFFLGFGNLEKHDKRPFLLMDDYSRICVNRKLEIVGTSNVQIQKEACLCVDDFCIGDDSEINCEYQLRLIGKVSAGKNVTMKDSLKEHKPVIVEDDVNIGSDVLITPGTYIQSAVSVPDNTTVSELITPSKFGQG